MANIRIVKLSSAAGPPEVEIIFGQAHVGSYRCFLWDKNGENSQEIAHGNNVDPLPDKFSLGLSATDLNQRIFSCEAIISAPSSGPGQLFSLTILFRQDGIVVSNGMIQHNGALDDSKALVEFVRFTV